jgi:general stress protein 26
MESKHNLVRGNDAQSRERLWGLIGEIRFAMLTTHHVNGHLHSRPVTTQNSKLDEDANLWFFMSRSGEPVADMLLEPSVNVAYADPGKDAYVSVSGMASIVDDMAKKQQLWSKMAEAWFPKGVNDPDLALVKVEISHANYWDVKESKIVQLYKMAKAVVTGEPPVDLGEQAEIRMR